MFKDDEMKADGEKKLKARRPRKVIKKSHMEDSYPTYLQVCMLLLIMFTGSLCTNRLKHLSPRVHSVNKNFIYCMVLQ